MRAFLFALLAIGSVSAQWSVPDDKLMPDVLIERAKLLIIGAEAELERHFTEGNRHLTRAFEAEIETLRLLVRELEALDQFIDVDLHYLHEVEERLFRSENRLTEEGLYIANTHDEEEHRRNSKHHQNEESERVLPVVLAERARAIILAGEYELKNHLANGLGHLTQGMEKEIAAVKETEKELLALDKEKHLELHRLHEYESRLLHHENRLLEEEFFVLNRHREEEAKKNQTRTTSKY